MWKTIHKILKPNKKVLDCDPDELNKHFNKTSERLTASQRTKSGELRQYIENLPAEKNGAFQLKPVTYEQIKSAISKIRNDCSSGPDALPINLLKPVTDFIIFPLTHIINGFIKNNQFPVEWKQARISPIPKTPSPMSPSDYRPISVLPVLSKVFEIIVMNQLTDHIEQSASYQNSQHGFRRSHSTITCLLKLRDDIFRAMGRDEITIGVFADFSKAFDTIDYKVLIEKLYNLNLSHDFLHWIADYLSQRCHFVQFDDKTSKKLKTGFGGPQGSMLGPVLFNLYVADLAPLLKHSNSLQYADDTSIYSHCKPSNIVNSVAKIEEDI